MDIFCKLEQIVISYDIFCKLEYIVNSTQICIITDISDITQISIT